MSRKIVYIIILISWSLGPLAWQLFTSFCTPEAIINPFEVLGSRWTLDNYKNVLSSSPPFYIHLINSTLVGIYTTVVTLLMAVPASYALCKVPKNLQRISYLILVATALFPYVLLFLALLEIARSLNLGNNLFALSIPYAGLSLPLAILILTSAFKDLPKDLEEAAKLDGLNLWDRFRWILLPLIGPASGSTAILIFLFSWNEYPIALTWISQSNLLTLPVSIARIAGSSIYSIPYGPYAASTVLSAIPLFIIMIIFQRQIVSGLTQGAIKG